MAWLSLLAKPNTDGENAIQLRGLQKAGLPVFNQIKELRKGHPIAEWERKTRVAFHIN